MKNSPSAESRFTCRVVRGCLSIFGDTSGPEPRGLGASHVAACEDCQQFFGACDQLTVALKRDAGREWREPPTNLEQNIMRAVKLSTADAVSSPRTSRGAWMSFGAVAACAVAVAVVFQYRAPTRVSVPATGGRVATNPADAADPAMVNAANQIIDAVPSDLLAQMQPKAQELLEKNPLQTEVDAITSDARIAVRFLARNFLPTASTPAGSGE